MTKILELLSNERAQYLAFFGLSLGAAVLVGVLYYCRGIDFQQFLGRIQPLAAIFIVTLLGFILITFLLSRGWFVIYGGLTPGRLFSISGLALLFGAVILLVDLKFVFPVNINKPFPDSLFFYPALGYVAEIMFHVLPLTLLLVSLTWLFPKAGFDQLVLPAIFIAALVEPIYQTVLGSPRGIPSGLPDLWPCMCS
jgi:hypothetical protein